jgi:hypothetical protein
MGHIGRILTIAFLLLTATSAAARQGLAPDARATVQSLDILTVENRSGEPALITMRHPDLGSDSSRRKCVAPGASAHFLAEARSRAVVSAETRSGAHCTGRVSCAASTAWPAGTATVSFSSDGRACAIGTGRKMLAARSMFNWARLRVENTSTTEALAVTVSPQNGDGESACLRPASSAEFLVPPGEQENGKRGRYNRYVEAALMPVGSLCRTKILCRTALEVEWMVPGDRAIAVRAWGEGRGLRCELQIVR